VELAIADVDRRDARSAALEQDVGEAAGGGADVERVAAGGVDAERVEGVGELLPAAGDVGRRALDRERRVLVHLGPGLLVPRHEPGQDERLGLRAALGQPTLDEQHVEPLLHAASVDATFTGSDPATEL
jgi:hypothetical protein